jgi:transposase
VATLKRKVWVIFHAVNVCEVKMESKVEQRMNVKFCVKLNKSPSETLEMLKSVYGESTMSKSNVFKWHKRFREGREDVNDDERSGAPVTKRTDDNVAKIRELVLSDHLLTCRTIADKLDMSKETVRKIIVQDLPMRKHLSPCRETSPTNQQRRE